MVKGAPKCRICKETHFGVCGVGDARGLATSELDQLEMTISLSIARGTQLFLDAGKALEKIHDGKLYRPAHKTFEEYCQARWGFTRQRAYQLIAGATVVGFVNSVDKPANESQARELVKAKKQLGEGAVQEVWDEAGDKPTAKTIRKAVQQRLGSGEVEQACTHQRHKCADCGKVLNAD